MAKRPVKEKFDKTAFVFDTPLDDIIRGMQSLYRKAESEQLSESELYWLGWWELNLPKAESSSLGTVKTCAQENAALGIYHKRKRSTKSSPRKTKKS
ncbi:hypothetical protein isim_148 [Escherichia phage isim]|uniref:Transposase-like protein n=1 Tax=Escherichia phage isim TaxID=2696409 RepID=A0A6B9WZT5_9CAUD|nr:hypothetical protein isim_148 [Escherichia phage isim]